MDTTLVVMAAGIGSRFGGLKQMEPIGPNGEVLLDYSVYDAVKAGFNKVVFVIRKENEADFKKYIGDRIAKMVEVEYVFQSTDLLPAGRTKPFGTGHAILCCKDAVTTPFAVINADDYYGKTAYDQLHNYLINASGFNFAMVAFDLKNTLTDNGTVARGVCEVENGYLKSIVERTKIKDMKYTEDGENWIEIPDGTVVSMNLWGFTTEIFDVLQRDFDNFLKTANLQKDEFFLPFVVDDLIKASKAKITVINSHDKWYGMTYREDVDTVKSVMAEFCRQGQYDGV